MFPNCLSVVSTIQLLPQQRRLPGKDNREGCNRRTRVRKSWFATSDGGVRDVRGNWDDSREGGETTTGAVADNTLIRLRGYRD
ncbi:hypothetical protein J1N35_021739 [Gossypium stocksii]|uniref:Uncharacterized protein n=1 Tax=Gossypium stocksii TaxID=47602 RepID=A0A9D3VFE0_9ROSI|nr:hypothetical protein J1N35_021739 [Gossypium stocksii]